MKWRIPGCDFLPETQVPILGLLMSIPSERRAVRAVLTVVRLTPYMAQSSSSVGILLLVAQVPQQIS
jgi:hypothetical protein